MMEKKKKLQKQLMKQKTKKMPLKRKNRKVLNTYKKNNQ